MAPLDSVRNEFEQIIKNDLLGPWQGKDEVILQAPKSRSVVGMLAPIIVDAEEVLPEEDAKGVIDDEGSTTSIGEEQIGQMQTSGAQKSLLNLKRQTDQFNSAIKRKAVIRYLTLIVDFSSASHK